MKKDQNLKKLIFGALLAVISSPSLADEWSHAAAPMGQYEGGISNQDRTLGINYGCSGLGSSIQFYAEGVHVAKGASVLSVDGVDILTDLDTTYRSSLGQTRVDISGKSEYGPESVAKINKVIDALGSGLEAAWITPSGKTFSFTLKDSAGIKSCTIY